MQIYFSPIFKPMANQATTNIKNVMFKGTDKKTSKCDGKEKGVNSNQPQKKQQMELSPEINDTEGYRIITNLFKAKDAKTIVNRGSKADVLGMTVLALASSVGHMDAVKSLLDAKADVNKQSKDGNYPLIQAVRGKFSDIVDLLLKNGAKVTLTNYDGDNAFMISVTTGDATIINAIWRYRGDLDIDHANKYGKAALHLATERRWEGCVEFLLLNGAQTNSRNVYGGTPLFVSVTLGDQKITEKLVAKGTDILIEDKEGFCAICRGVEAEQHDVVSYLLNKLTNAEKDAYAKSRLERLKGYTTTDADNDTDRVFFDVLYTIFSTEMFKDTLYRVKAIPNVLQYSRQYVDLPEVMSTMFIMCAMLMTDLGTIVDERFTLQFLRAQGQDLVIKTLKLNSDFDRLDMKSHAEASEPCLVAGLALPIVCLCGLEEGREWLQKNVGCVPLVRVTDYLRTGSAIENFFNCNTCPAKFRKVWQAYLEFFDSTMSSLRVHNEANLLRDEERTKLKAQKKRERKRLQRQKNKETKDENVNKNANGKVNTEHDGNIEIGAEMSHERHAEDNVRYDQHVLMPDWNVCIENVRENDGNIIQTKRDPMQFRYNYVEPTHCKKTNGYHMPQTAASVWTNQCGEKSEWHKVEHKKVAGMKSAVHPKQLQVNQNAGDSKRQQKRREVKPKEAKKQEVTTRAPRPVGGVCWADIAKGHTKTHVPSHQQQQDKEQIHHQPQPTNQHQIAEEQSYFYQHYQPHREQPKAVQSPPNKVFTEEDFPTLHEDADKVGAYDTDVSEAQSTSTISMYGEEQIDHIPDPVTESDVVGTMPEQQREVENEMNNGYPNPYMTTQQQPPLPQLVPNFHLMGQIRYPPPNVMCRYGLESRNPPPGFQEQMIQMQNLAKLAQLQQNYGFNFPFPQGQIPQPVTIANIAQSLLQPQNPVLVQGEYQFATQTGVHDIAQAQHENCVALANDKQSITPVLNENETKKCDIWTSNQQPDTLTDCPQLDEESVWTSYRQEDESIDGHCQEEAHERSENCPQDTRSSADATEASQSSQNELVDDFSKILTSLAKTLSKSASESVLFPETLRDEEPQCPITTVAENQNHFPGFHEMESTVTANSTLNPFVLENLAKEQVKRQYRTIAGKPLLENSAHFHDFDYYASLYGLTTEELKANAARDLQRKEQNVCKSNFDVDVFKANPSTLRPFLEEQTAEHQPNFATQSEYNKLYPEVQANITAMDKSCTPTELRQDPGISVLFEQTQQLSPVKHRDAMPQNITSDDTFAPEYNRKEYSVSPVKVSSSMSPRHGGSMSPSKQVVTSSPMTNNDVASPSRFCSSPHGPSTAPNESTDQPEANWTPQSRRWKDKLAQIIEMPFNKRQQLGKIVVPINVNGFRINKSGGPVVLGFLSDGCEVAVHELEADREVVDKELVKKLASSDTKYNFLLRYKALAEMGSHHYLATELCDYTLEEYVSITRLDHHHDPLATNRLAWQLLKGVRYLHEDIGIVHGNLRLMREKAIVQPESNWRLPTIACRSADIITENTGVCSKPDNIYVDGDAKLRVGGYGIVKMDKFGQFSKKPAVNSCWRATETFAEDESSTPTASSDVQVVGMLLNYILTGGRHPYGASSFEIELNLCQNSTKLTFISEEANHLISAMLFSEVEERPSIDTCLRHPFFWSEEKRFRMVLIAGSDILKEMKTGVALTGTGSTTMTDFLNVPEHQTISDGWMNMIEGAVLKEMRAFRQYKNTLAEMVLFIYNCCLHFDKMSYAAREALDDPCRYFLQRFPPLFMAVYRAIKESDRTDRTCYRPFF